jgi:nicotinate-nucleotide pyrophosphorylase
MLFMIEDFTTLKKIIQQMGPVALEEVLNAIRARPDIVSLDVITTKELAKIEKYYANQTIEKLSGVSNESV